ncbi:hypothetical protein Tco_0392461, partial [Tanacetum coccineum]
MANIRTCNKHNMVACVEKTAHNADFYQIIDYLTGCSINYSLLVNPDLIGPWLQQFWATASLRVINEVPHIRAMVAGKRQVIWDSLRDIGYEGNLAQLTFSKPLFSPQWKYLVHVLLHCLSPKSTSWEQFGTNIASALIVIVLSSHCRINLLTLPMLEVITTFASRDAHSESTHSRAASSPRDAQGTPTQSAAPQGTAETQGTADFQDTAEAQGTADFQGTAEAQGAADIPHSPNDYTPTDASQTSGGDEGLWILLCFNQEVRRLKKQTISQANRFTSSRPNSRNVHKTVSSVKLGRNKDESNLSEEHHDQDDHRYTAFVYEDVDATEAVVTPDLERKSDETEEVLIEEEKDASDVKSGDTKELDLERIQSTARQSIVTPRTLNFDDEA